MREWSVDVGGTALEQLAKSIADGPVLEIKDGKPIRMLMERTVAYIDSLKVEVFSNEHPPPHFRVKYQGSKANFEIATCQHMNGSGDIMRFEKNIQVWWKDNKNLLIKKWDDGRPDDCPVGKYRD